MIAMQIGIWVGYPSVDLIYRHITLPSGSFSADLWCRIGDVQGII